MNQSLTVGDEERGRLKDNCIVGEKLGNPVISLSQAENRDVLKEGGAHEHVLLTVNGRKLMLIYSSYIPCNLLEK